MRWTLQLRAHIGVSAPDLYPSASTNLSPEAPQESLSWHAGSGWCPLVSLLLSFRRPLPKPVNEARAHLLSGFSLPGVAQRPHFLAEEAEAQWGDGIAGIGQCQSWTQAPPRSLHDLLFCHASCWPGLKWRGRGLVWERVREDFITQCLLVAGEGGAVPSPPPAGRHAWPAWVITSQHFILLVSFHFLGMWAPKYFIPACSRPFLPRQTAGPAAGPWLRPLPAQLRLRPCTGGGAGQRSSSSHPCPTQGSLPPAPHWLLFSRRLV